MGDLSNLLFLPHGDNPRVSLVSRMLTRENYHAWSRSMIMPPSAKNELGIVEGTIKKPAIESREYRIHCNNIICYFHSFWIRYPRPSHQVSFS